MGKFRAMLSLAVVAAAVGVGAAVVTSGGDGDGGGLSLVARSVDALDDAGTYRATFEMSMEGLPGDAEGFTSTGEGEFDATSAAGRMTMRMGMAALGTENLEFEMRLVDGVIYMNMGALGAQAGAPTPWISMDLSTLPGVGDVFGGGGFGTTDPTQFLEFLRGAEDATDRGREDVRGVPTTHYGATVNFQDALEAAPAEQREAMQALLDGAPSDFDFSGFEFPIDAWIDDTGLPRRIRMEMDLSQFGQGEIPGGTTMTFSMEMFDYGIDVNVEPPPADQVTDMTDLLGAGG